MKNIESYVKRVGQVAVLAGLGFLAYKLIRNWQTGTAAKTGHAIDNSVNAAAENLEKAALALENLTNKNPGEHLGKGLDGMLMEAKQKIERATKVVQNALGHVQSKKVPDSVPVLD